MSLKTIDITHLSTEEALACLEKHIGGKDYAVKHITGRGSLCVELHFQWWIGKSGWTLFWRGVRLLWQVFRRVGRS